MKMPMLGHRNERTTYIDGEDISTGITMNDYREWRMSMRDTSHFIVFTENGNCQDFLEFEDDDNMFRRYFVQLNIDAFRVEVFKEKPKKKITEQAIPKHSVDIRYISKVSKITHKCKRDFSFEICTPKRKYIFCASNEDHMNTWITAISKAATSPPPRSATLPDSFRNKKTSSVEDVRTSDQSYHTSIVGGVVVRTPNEEFQHKRKSSSKAATTTGVKVIYEGWSFKQGYIMKNWKRRYFRLNCISLSYYENDDPGKEPIRSILTPDIHGVRILPTYCNRVDCLEVETPNRKFYMHPDNKGEVTRWKNALEEIVTNKPKSSISSFERTSSLST